MAPKKRHYVCLALYITALYITALYRVHNWEKNLVPKRNIIAYRPKVYRITKIQHQNEKISFSSIQQPNNLNIVYNSTKNGIEYPLVLDTSVTSVIRQRLRDASDLCSLLKGFLRMTFFGKLHVFSRFFFREPSLALGGFSNTNLASKKNTREHKPRLSGPSARIPTVFPLFGKKLYLLAQGHFGRDGEDTIREKNNRPKSSKTKIVIANAGTAKLRRQTAHRAGASEWNCCRLLCGLLFRFAQLFVLRCFFT